MRLKYMRTWLYMSAIALMTSIHTSYASETFSFYSSSDTSLSSLSNHQLAFVATRAQKSQTSAILDINDKAITNVKVFFNPVAEQVAVSFKLSKLSHVSIRVMDALGNEVMGLMNGELDGGVQSLSFDTNGKLAAGFYFVRVTCGSETIIKRISIR